MDETPSVDIHISPPDDRVAKEFARTMTTIELEALVGTMTQADVYAEAANCVQWIIDDEGDHLGRCTALILALSQIAGVAARFAPLAWEETDAGYELENHPDVARQYLSRLFLSVIRAEDGLTGG